MFTAVCREAFACGSWRQVGSCNEVGMYTLEMQCCISFKQWENRDVLGPSGIPLMPNWISYIASQQLQFLSLLQDEWGHFYDSLKKQGHSDGNFRGSLSAAS